MAIVITYVCDVSGKSGTNKNDFVKVNVVGNWEGHPQSYSRGKSIEKWVSLDIANKMGLVNPAGDLKPEPEVTFESKLKLLLEDHVANLVQDHLDNQ